MTASQDRRPLGRNFYIIFIAACVLIIAAVIIFVITSNSRHTDYARTVYDSDVFFLPENDKHDARYALFKNNGDRITDYKFAAASNFIDGYALVRDTDGEFGIIRTDGSMSVDFEKYEIISSEGGFYQAINGDNISLIVGNGDIIGASFEQAVITEASPFAIVERGGNSYNIIDVKGRTISSITSDSRPVIESVDERMFSVVHYDHHNLFLDNKSLSIIHEYDSDLTYRTSTIDLDHDAAILVSPAAEGNDNIVYYYKGKIHDMNANCAASWFYGAAIGDTGYFTCIGEDARLIRDGYITDIVVDDNVIIFDEDHYAIYHSDDKKLEIFENGTSVATVSSTGLPYLSNASYLTRNDNVQEIYGLDGKSVYRTESAKNTLSGLDKNDHIVIDYSSDEIEHKIALADKQGNKISDYYIQIESTNSYYIANKESGTDILNAKGELVATGSYGFCSLFEATQYLICGNDEHSDVIDLLGKKITFSFDGRINYIRYGYLVAMDDDNYYYYTLEGKKFHEYAKVVEVLDE